MERNPLSWADMRAWAEITQRSLLPWQWSALLALDDVVMGRWEDPSVKPVTLVDKIAALAKKKDD